MKKRNRRIFKFYETVDFLDPNPKPLPKEIEKNFPKNPWRGEAMNFDKMGILELQKLARGKVKGYSRLRKAALLKALKGLSPTEGGEVDIASDLPVDTAQPQFVRPEAIKCPRCGATDTVAYSVHGNIQYRRCRRAVCRHNFSVRREQ